MKRRRPKPPKIKRCLVNLRGSLAWERLCTSGHHSDERMNWTIEEVKLANKCCRRGELSEFAMATK